jgi:hypothetical protein
MKLKSNFIYILISALPIIVLFFFYGNLQTSPYTKISGSNGIIVTKNVFIILIIGLGILWYYLSILLAQKLAGLSSIVSQSLLRGLVNAFFSTLSLLLIFSNT